MPILKRIHNDYRDQPTKFIKKEVYDKLIAERDKKLKAEEVKNFNEKHAADGKFDVGSSALHVENHAKLNVVKATPQEAKVLKKASRYIKDNEIEEGVKISVTDLGSKYGNTSGKNIYVDSKTVSEEHPLFIASVIYHENQHVKQNKNLDAKRKEFDARFKTKIWAQIKQSQNKASPDELVAIKKIVDASAQNMFTENFNPTHDADGKFGKRSSAKFPGRKRGETLGDYAIRHIAENYETAKKLYQEKTVKDFDTNRPNIVAADDAKYVIPGFSAEKSTDYHEASSTFAKKYYDELLAEPDTTHLPVLFTAGGTGAGKSTALKGHTGDFGSYNAVYDGNMANFETARGKIDKALKSGRSVQVVYVDRDPVTSFRDGVIPRIAKEGRLITVSTHINTHVNSRETVKQLDVHYAKETNVSVRVIDNNGPLGDQHEIPVYKTTKKVYNKTKLREELLNELNQAQSQGTITQEIYEVVKNSSTEKTSNIIDARDVKTTRSESTTRIESDFNEIITNSYDEDGLGVLALQQGSLQSEIVRIETLVSTAVLNKVTKNELQEDDIIDQKDRNAYLKELILALSAYYLVVVPLFAKTTASARLQEFGKFTDFKVNAAVKKYIKEIATKSANSHMDTILNDLLNAINEVRNEAGDKVIADGVAQGRSASDPDLVLARKKAMEGVSQQEIVNAVTNKYQDISKNRAKAIARTETNRAFAQSQFQADKQFIEQNPLTDGKRYYKQWVTTNPEPCPTCLDLAHRPPVPFETNFADLGETITSVYVIDGKTKVKKNLVNFEPLVAGNAHVNCGCRYKLIVK